MGPEYKNHAAEGEGREEKRLLLRLHEKWKGIYFLVGSQAENTI